MRLAIPRFYLRTSDGTILGPYTGLELREAALARLVNPDMEMACAAEGPWMPAASAGLFVGEDLPLPHPPGTTAPEFRVTLVNEAFESTLSLQGLIDLAVRKELPGDAAIQPVGHRHSIPMNQFPILNACLQDELSRVAASNALADASPNAVQQECEKPPVTRTVHNANLLAAPEDDIDLVLSDHRERVQKNARKRIASGSKYNKFQFKTAYVACLILLLPVGVLAWWISQPTPMGTDLGSVVGDWVLIPSQKQRTAFGISFRENGTCVVFNSNGNCWTGDFQWFDDANSEASHRAFSPTNSKAAGIPSHHHRFAVQSSDALVRLSGGPPRDPPMLEGKPIRECFLRQDGAYLWIGYFFNAEESDNSQSPDVAWVSLWPRSRPADSQTPEFDLPMQGTKLLSLHGVPDEARPINTLEVDANRHPDSAEPRGLVRYGTTQLTVFADSSVRRTNAPQPSRAASTLE